MHRLISNTMNNSLSDARLQRTAWMGNYPPSFYDVISYPCLDVSAGMANILLFKEQLQLKPAIYKYALWRPVVFCLDLTKAFCHAESKFNFLGYCGLMEQNIGKYIRIIWFFERATHLMTTSSFFKHLITMTYFLPILPLVSKSHLFENIRFNVNPYFWWLEMKPLRGQHIVL